MAHADLIPPPRDINTSTAVDPFLRIAQVARVTGLSNSTIKRKSADAQDTFPAPFRVTDYATGWKQSELVAWMADQPRIEKRPKR